MRHLPNPLIELFICDGISAINHLNVNSVESGST